MSKPEEITFDFSNHPKADELDKLLKGIASGASADPKADRSKIVSLLREMGCPIPPDDELETVNVMAVPKEGDTSPKKPFFDIVQSKVDETVKNAKPGTNVKAFHSAGTLLDKVMEVTRTKFILMATLPSDDMKEEFAHDRLHEMLNVLEETSVLIAAMMPCLKAGEGEEGKEKRHLH